MREVHDPLQLKHEQLNDCYYGKVKPRSEDWMSNFPILMGATFTDATTARFVNTMFAYKPTFVYEPTRNRGWDKVAGKFSDFVEYKVKMEMKLYREARKVIFESTRLGAGVLLMPWVRKTEIMPVRTWLGTRKIEVVTADGPVAKALPLRDFIYPGGFSEVEDLPWWSRRMRWTEMMLKQQKARDVYSEVDKVLKWDVPVDQDQLDAQVRAGEEPGLATRVIGRETYLWWDVKDNGEYQRYVCTWHPDTMAILRFEEDNYPSWPLVLFRYGPRDYGILGLGVMEMVKPYDDALYSLYNLLVDNFKVSTMQVFAGKKGINLTANTKIYPGKFFLLNDPQNDLVAKAMGQPFQLNPAFTRLVWELGERRAGISDYALGRESSAAGSRATATGTIALIQEGQRRLDLTIQDYREGMDGLGMFLAQSYHQQLDRKQAYLIMGEDGGYIEEFLNIPSMPPGHALSVKSSMSRSTQNKETEKQDALATFQLLEKYYSGVVQLLMLMQQVSPGVQQTLQKIISASADKLKKVLELHGEMVPEHYTDIVPGAAPPPPPGAGMPGGGEGGEIGP